MRSVSRYQATAATAPTVRAVVCDAGGTDLRVSIRYPARISVVTMATRRPIRDALLVTFLVQLAHKSPGASPVAGWPQPEHRWLEPAGHSPGELGGRSTPPQILGADVVLHDRRLERPAQPARGRELVDVIEHHRGGEQLGRRVRDPLPRDVRRRAVHRLEDRRVLADVRPRREPEPAHQSRCFVGEDVPEQVRRDDHIELRRVDHELHRRIVHDLLVRRDLPFVLLGDHPRGLEEQPRGRLEDIRLVHHRHLPPVVLPRVLERVPHDTPAAVARHHRRGLGKRLGVVAHLEGPVEPDPEGVEHLQGRLGDLRPDSITGDEGRLTRHGSPGVRVFTARVSAVHGSSPSPRATVRKPTRPVRTSTRTTVSSAVATACGRGAACGAPTLPGPPPSAVARLYVSPAGTSAYRPPPANAASVRSSLRSGSGTISGCCLVGWNRIAVPIWSGAGAIPGARRATRRSSSGSTQVTSGARALSSVPMILSLCASAVRRSPRTASQCSESSAATSVSGSTPTRWAAIPAVGSGAVGSGVGVADLRGHAVSTAEVTTHHAPRTKLLI